MKQGMWAAALAIAASATIGCAAETGAGGASGASGFGGVGGASGVGGLGGVGGSGAFSGSSGIGGTSGFGGVGGVGGVNGGAGGTNSCAMGMASAARVTPTVMLVVDGSCSMSTEYPGGTPDTIACTQSATNRWSALRSALVDPTNGIVSLMQGVVRFGLGVYGTIGQSGQCPFVLGRIEPALNNLPAISNGLPATPPGLSTPTPDALTQVFASLPDTSQVLDMDLGPQIVILATDGAPNGCTDFFTQTQAQSIQAAMAGQAKGIRMFVISLAAPNGPLQQHLQQMAMVGDPNNPNATAYAPTDPTSLSNTLQQIIGGALGCEVALNGRVTAGMECNGSTVELNSTALVCNDPNGWILADESHIRLQGTACDEFKANTASIVRADFPCSIFIPD